jgi:hypothetical protein
MRLLRNATLLIAAALLAMGLTRSASADVIAYAATAQGDFGTLDLDTGLYTHIGSTGVTSIVGMGSIGGVLYGVDNNGAGAGFYSINTTDGSVSPPVTLVDANTGLPITAYGGTTAYGNFYGVTQEGLTNLFQTAPPGSPAFLINPLGFTADGLVALDKGAQNLYISEYTGDPINGDELHRVNVDGTVHDVGALGQQAITGLINGDTLYAIDGSSIFTYTVSPGGVSYIATTAIFGGPIDTNGDQVFAVAVATPEPSSVAIVSIMLATAGFVHARRRYKAS